MTPTCTCPFNEKGRFALDAACPMHGQPLSAGCNAIEAARKAIVQTPDVAQEQAREALRAFADRAGERTHEENP